jgi:hypothetical protein
MSLNPEQKKTVSDWVAAGDGLSAIQKKLSEQFGISMTYMDVRFLVDDLNLKLKDAVPTADASDVSKGAPAPAAAAEKGEKKGFLDKAKEKLGLSGDPDAAQDEPPSGVRITVDKVSLNPAALASGTVTFSDGVTGKWMVDQQGRPGLLDVSKPGYRPSQADAQAFMQELAAALQHL